MLKTGSVNPSHHHLICAEESSITLQSDSLQVQSHGNSHYVSLPHYHNNNITNIIPLLHTVTLVVMSTQAAIEPNLK